MAAHPWPDRRRGRCSLKTDQRRVQNVILTAAMGNGTRGIPLRCVAMRGAVLVLFLHLVMGGDLAWGHQLHDVGSAVPEDRPARGLIYRDLNPAPSTSPCAGGFQVETNGPIVCTHGPDPAPPGVDVRKPQSVARLRADTFGSGAPTAPSADAPGALVPCIGDGVSGDRVQVIYARPADRPDRFGALRSLIETWAAETSGVFNESAAQTGGSRLVRFVTQPSPDCELKIDNVPLSSTADDSFGNTISELREIGYNRSDRKYMVFMDANVLCGIGQIIADDRPGGGNNNNGVSGVPGSIGRTDVSCWGQLGNWSSVEAHELIHNLGGVQLSAPHSSGGWHCVDEYDTECYSDEPYFPTMQFVCPGSEESLLDCHDDDYFNTNPSPGNYLVTHWNVANSDFLTSSGEPVHPPNDAFAQPQLLTGAEVVRDGDSNNGATKEVGEPAHAGNAGGASIWYSWTAPANSQVVLDTAGSDFDTLLAVYTGGSVDSLTEIGSNDNVAPESDLTSQVTFDAIGGQTYMIAVDGSGGAAGTVQLQLSGGTPPANDTFASAQPLLGSEVSRGADTNRNATKEAGEPAHAGNAGGASIWYSWTAPANSQVVLDTAGSDFDTLLAVYTGGSLSSLVEVASNDDASSSLTSKVEFAATSGQTYRIAVDGFSGGDNAAVGEVQLHLVAVEPPPANDAFASAQPLLGSEVSRGADTNRNATKEAGEPAHAGNAGGASIWYSWTAPANSQVVLDTAGSDFDTTLAAYIGSPVSSLTEVASNDDFGGLQTSRVEFMAHEGVTYRIAVDGYMGSDEVATGDVRFRLAQSEEPPPNDSFNTPTLLNGINAFRSYDSNVGATKETSEPNHGSNAGGASVWYSWTAPANSQVVLDTAGSDFDTLLAVYTGGSLSSLVEVASNDNATLGMDLTSKVEFAATSGQTYRIAVDGVNWGDGASRGAVYVHLFQEPSTQSMLLSDPPFWSSRAAYPPRTRIVSGPRGRIYSRRATFRFKADQPATFACRIDSLLWSPCTSPAHYRQLARGGHLFQVRARNSLGLVDPVPAKRSIRVVR